MKNVMTDLKMYSLYLGMFLLTLGMTSCSDDDDAGDITQPQPTATIEVSDQTVSQNTLVIDRVTVGQDSWLVVRNAGSENSPDIVSDPVFLTEGTHENVEVNLNEDATLTGNEAGDDLVVMIHADDPDAGTPGEFDYNGQNGADLPVTDNTGAALRSEINVSAPSLQVDDDQMVTEEGDITFTSINTGATGGYIALYGENEDGSVNEDEMIGQSGYIEPGLQTNVSARFNDGYVYEAGQTVYPRLHIDNPTDQEFTYTFDNNEDIPEVYGFDEQTGAERVVRNTANTAAPGGFTIGNSGTVQGTGTGADM